MTVTEHLAETPEKQRKGRRPLAIVAALASVAVLVVGIAVASLGTDDIIDLPEWANISGIDIPLVGDTDQIDCRLRQVPGTETVEITIVDGDETEYHEYTHVWNNGRFLEPDELIRVNDHTLIVPTKDGTDEQFYSIALAPIRDENLVFCESVFLAR